MKKIEKSKLKKLITSDSIEIKNKSKKVEHLTCSKIFAEAMFNVHNNKSIDKLFIK
jgi:phosphoribosylpyrophosphate synthetase